MFLPARSFIKLYFCLSKRISVVSPRRERVIPNIPVFLSTFSPPVVVSFPRAARGGGLHHGGERHHRILGVALRGGEEGGQGAIEVGSASIFFSAHFASRSEINLDAQRARRGLC